MASFSSMVGGMPFAPLIIANQESLTLLELGITEYWLFICSLSSSSRNVFRKLCCDLAMLAANALSLLAESSLLAVAGGVSFGSTASVFGMSFCRLPPSGE